jgi:acetylornithine/succinyldiaminopimelate/putrescine aminotransferase
MRFLPQTIINEGEVDEVLDRLDKSLDNFNNFDNFQKRVLIYLIN